MRLRLTLLLLVVLTLPALAAPPAQTTWFGYPIVAETIKSGTPPASCATPPCPPPIPVLNVGSKFQLGVVPPPWDGVTPVDPRVYWRLTPGGGGTAPTTRSWWGPPEIARPYSGPPLLQYLWAPPLQSRFFQGIQIGPDPDGTLRWKYDDAASKDKLKLTNPHWLGILRTGLSSVNDATSASQPVPWPPIEVGIKDTTQMEGQVIWRVVLPHP